MKDLQLYKEKLLAEKEKLENSLAMHGKELETGDWVAVPPVQDESEQDPTSRADYVEEFESDVATLSNLEQSLEAVNLALDTIENTPEKYAVCTVCGKEIEDTRLEANPAATTCIEHLG